MNEYSLPKEFLGEVERVSLTAENLGHWLESLKARGVPVIEEQPEAPVITRAELGLA